MTSRLALYNGALRKLGQPRLSALTDEGKGRRALDDCYDEVVAFCLERGLWNFAMRLVELETTPSADTTFGYSCIFDKPDDWIRTAGVTSDPRGNSPLLAYDDRADYWLADIDTIYVRYVSNDPAYGLDLGRWPESFVQYVQTVLAFESCETVTGSDSRKGRLEKDVKAAFSNASNKDAMNEPSTRFLPVGRILSARGSAYNRQGWRR